ncbi:MAG: phosphoribosylanthranilate isomerase [Clostridiales bacterium]|nr:phosphoribosylanthranilate isomerase [Clostridiales bacterium]
MSGTKIKICGLSRPADVEAANRLKPEFIGFVFFKKSKRYVDPETAAALRRILDQKIKAVGVFVDAPVEEVSELLSRGIIDFAQLHGHEDEEYIAALRKFTEKPLIRAFQLPKDASGEQDPKEILRRAQESSADYVLIDSGMGSGEPFDWSLLQGFGREYFLAGGLDAENVGEAITRTSAWAVDVSSNVETDGKKDEEKMREFVHAVRKSVTAGKQKEEKV